MKTVLIIHGIGGHAGIHWQQWLHDQLQAKGYRVLMPELPNADHPDRNTWIEVIQKEIADINTQDLIIVGHSLGVTTALDLIEDTAVAGLVSVAGFAEAYGAELNEYFLQEKHIDFSKVAKNLQWSSVVYGNDDPYVAQEALKYVASSLEVKPIVIDGGGHLNTDTGFTAFPTLLEIIEKRDN